jgi:predicted transcriptional regulator
MQTRLNRLSEKRLVHKTDDRPAKYRAAVTTEQVSAGHIGHLLDNIGRRQLVPLVANLLSGNQLTREEIDELKLLLAQAEKAESQKADEGEKP